MRVVEGVLPNVAKPHVVSHFGISDAITNSENHNEFGRL